METFIFAAFIIIGGWMMYAIGYRHGHIAGSEETLDRVAERYQLNHRLYDLNYK